MARTCAKRLARVSVAHRARGRAQADENLIFKRVQTRGGQLVIASERSQGWSAEPYLAKQEAPEPAPSFGWMQACLRIMSALD
jgi:hypothetical protein